MEPHTRNDPTRPDDDPLAWLTTTTIITTQAREDVGRVHDRMPLTINQDDVEAWLDPDHTDPAQLLKKAPDAPPLT
ncbi:SOS response-associated peptidase family protein [Kitasatospora sp. MAP12-44]|uniref:SOS response-associated peptidase family protein n=1 Tax=unclassified Kitasatospora TaxID=2633591 RepID=UPI002473FE55|nr:SOS response-associated peptidase family protein [Kitasatospora sp. MAP12-44]